jgi:hypothetical protein
MPGLMWLSEADYESDPLCLTFVRGANEREVFAGFGADPAGAVPARLGDALPGPGTESGVRVARSGEWLIAIEDGIPPQGTRPEVLRRLSAGGEAIALYQDIGEGDHEFVYAADGDIVAGVVTTEPTDWYGNDPEPIAARARELGLNGDSDDDDTDWEILLTLAQERFGLSMDGEDLNRPWPAARMLPLLGELPPPTPAKPAIGDPVVDLLLGHATEQTLRSVTSLRVGRLLEESGLAGYSELASAAQRIRTGPEQQVDDHGPVGLLLRRLARDAARGDHDLAVGQSHPGFSEEQTRERIRCGKVAWVLRFALAGRYRQALVNEMLLQRAEHPETWHQQAADDLAGVAVPAADMAAAERAWESTRHLPDPVTPVSTDSVREHIQRLLDSGMDKNRIAEFAGMTTLGIDRMMAGHIRVMPGLDARKILLIEPP